MAKEVVSMDARIFWDVNKELGLQICKKREIGWFLFCDLTEAIGMEWQKRWLQWMLGDRKYSVA